MANDVEYLFFFIVIQLQLYAFSPVEYLFMGLLAICTSSLDGGGLFLIKLLNVLDDKVNVTMCLLHFDVRKNVFYPFTYSFIRHLPSTYDIPATRSTERKNQTVSLEKWHR